MDQGAKKGLATAKKLIQQGKHQQALDDLEVMGYKYSKVYQVHLLMGCCYEKLNRPNDAEKAYLQVLDLNPTDSLALKQLCEIYTQRGDLEKGTKYLQLMANICKKNDNKKYREVIVKLINLYQKDCNMEKIDPIFQEYSATEDSIGEDFVHIAKAYFKVGVTNECFFLQKFEVMGVKGEEIRPVVPAAKQELNRLLVEIVEYLKAVSLKYELSKKDIANSIMQLKVYFPECATLLMMLLFDQYCVGQMSFSSYILGELYHLCQAHFDNVKNYYHNLRFTSPETFAVCMLLAKQYLCFFKQFFTLDPLLEGYYPKLSAIQDQLQAANIREDYRKRIDKFILKECRELSELSKRQNIEQKLSFMKERIQSLGDSYLEEVIAKIALHAFTSYDQLNDMKYKLKVRIKQLTPDNISPHLYKYYYDYVFKMARVYKSLDEQIPIKEVLTYITTHDASDLKFQLQHIWFDFCMQAKTVQECDRKQVALKAIQQIKDIESKLEFSVRSSALRRIMIIKVFAGELEIEQQVKAALLHQRSFENLQCAAFFIYYRGRYKEALILLRQAFKLNQSHYHLNRLFFLALYRCGQIKQAFAYLNHIHNTFGGVFWVNYFLGINKMNHQCFLEAEAFIVKALEAFQAGSIDNFRYYYQKVYDIGPFSLLHLVRQNQYSIFFDELIFPQEYLHKQLPALSNVYFQRDAELSRMKLLYKQGELLKILGRTKSSLNYLEEAYNQSLKIDVNAEGSSKALFDHAMVRKQYATLLFYTSQLRQAEQMLQSSYAILKSMLSEGQWPLAQKLSDEVQALFFEISISRLSIMMKFESQECISEYLNKFREGIHQPVKSSLTFLKNKYQFHILEFMHQRNNIDRVEQSVINFLAYFGLTFSERTTQSFAIRVQQLDQSQRKFVRECLEDYYIVQGLSHQSSQDELLHMICLFSRSSTLSVLFGSITTDVKLKTASFLKVIQLDKESAISMDILASLYLKQKNYLAAAKLFLKSLETDVLNPKCYLGLAICLFCLIVRAVEESQKQQIEIVRQCMVRINSYMQFIRLNDPFQNYHLLSFLRLLLSDKPLQHFSNKLILQAANKNCLRYRDSLLGQLLQEATNHWKDLNFWKSEHQIKIVQSFILAKLQENMNDHSKTAVALANRAANLCEELRKAAGSIGRQIALKKFQKILHQLGLSICLALKSTSRDREVFQSFVNSCTIWEKAMSSWNFSSKELVDLKQKIKSYLYSYILLGQWEPQMVTIVDGIFYNVITYDHLIAHYKKIPKFEREIARQLLLNPGNQQIRQICAGYQVAVKGWSLRKAKLSHRLELHNANNLNSMDDSRTYKQLSLLYRDPQAMLLFLSSQWSNSGLRAQQNVKKWVNIIEYLLAKPQLKQNAEMLEKATRMKLQMLAYLLVEFEFKMDCELNPYQQDKLDKLKSVYKIIKSIQLKQGVKGELTGLAPLFKGSNDDFDWWIVLTLISYIARRVKTDQRFEKLLQLLSEQVQGKLKAFVILVRFLVVVKKDTDSQDSLVEQIVQLTELCTSSQGIVSPTTEVILECAKCHSAGSWDDIEYELNKAAQTLRVTTYSDQVLINFFELLKQYKAAESNPNGQGVIQSFLYLADSMLQLIREPQLRGFVLSLKGMVMSLVEGESKSIKMAMLLSPQAAKGLLGSSHQ